jgi:hypothetical protein
MIPSIGFLIALCLIGGLVYSLARPDRDLKPSPRTARRAALKAAMFRRGFGAHRLRW